MKNNWWWIITVIVVVGLIFWSSNTGALFSPRPSIIAKNNTNSTNSTGLPDLTITILEANVSYVQNNSGNATGYWQADIGAYVKNVGRISAPISRTSFLVTGFGTRYISTSNLAPGQGILVRDKYTNIQRGTYNVTATTDGRFEISELNENNNGKSTRFTV
ncbi:hypothetical protein AUJ84_00150 [Candidatus Pacearchaeota archaeon CG1_02_32_132]|nr:MAG: hypothetical protein AUJ84_00150 [Candidatus Pacearchaeota archaeon CG1_02_32_132]